MQNVSLSRSDNIVIDIIVVFDGSGLPVKGNKCRERGALRELNRAKAQELVDLGKDDEAQKHFQRSVVVTSEMVQQVDYFTYYYNCTIVLTFSLIILTLFIENVITIPAPSVCLPLSTGHSRFTSSRDQIHGGTVRKRRPTGVSLQRRHCGCGDIRGLGSSRVW